MQNDATRKEKSDVLKNDLRVREKAGTHTRSQAIGASLPTYPEGPNWSKESAGQERPLGRDVNALDPNLSIEDWVNSEFERIRRRFT